jgi:hypothetical protein
MLLNIYLTETNKNWSLLLNFSLAFLHWVTTSVYIIKNTRCRTKVWTFIYLFVQQTQAILSHTNKWRERGKQQHCWSSARRQGSRLQDFNCMHDILHFIQKSGWQKNLTSNKVVVEQTNKSKETGGLANGKVSTCHRRLACNSKFHASLISFSDLSP